MAFRDGEKNDEALFGAMMVADGIDAVCAMREFLISLGKARR